MPKRLSLKLILALTVVVIVVSGLFSLHHIRRQRQHLLETMILGADQLSRSITSATWHAMLADHRTDAYDIMRLIGQEQGVDRIRMFNREGDLMFSTRQDEVDRADMESGVCAPCHASGQLRESLTVESRVRFGRSAEGSRTLNMVTPIYNEPACQTACHAHPETVRVLGVLDIALSLEPVDREAADITAQVAMRSAAEILVIAVCIVFFVRRFVSLPIRELIQGTKVVSAMELDRPVRIEHSSQEMDELVTSFNTMRERLRDALSEINQFTHRLETTVAERTGQLREAHRKLLQTDRLASLGQLSASVAHEINNPIAGVLNLSMLMQRILKDNGIPAGREEEFRRYLGQVVSETSRVGRIVSDLLAFSRRSKPQRVEADLNRVVETTVSLVAHKLKLNETEAELDLAPDLPLLLCDPSQMQQVVLNLVLNASEATHTKGRGHVAVRTRLAEDGGAVELVVEDNGEGIPPEIAAKIFDPFFTTKPEGKGVGLGLAVLYGIVRAHDGEVDVNSTAGEGTRFTVTLPLSSGPTPARDETASEAR
ncbi:MAG: HAMP domain-containing protein [Bryobacterales bacterium]|nr:HAMP domain-containing protein [Bryobacterales bacterium]